MVTGCGVEMGFRTHSWQILSLENPYFGGLVDMRTDSD